MTPLSPLTHPELDTFLLGFITATSLVAALFFLKFWRSSRDILFVAFVFFFIVQTFRESYVTSLDQPNAGTFWLFAIRFISVLGILAAIIWKNVGSH